VALPFGTANRLNLVAASVVDIVYLRFAATPASSATLVLRYLLGVAMILISDN
jgi:hypothetical protein